MLTGRCFIQRIRESAQHLKTKSNLPVEADSTENQEAPSGDNYRHIKRKT